MAAVAATRKILSTPVAVPAIVAAILGMVAVVPSIIAVAVARLDDAAGNTNRRNH